MASCIMSSLFDTHLSSYAKKYWDATKWRRYILMLQEDEEKQQQWCFTSEKVLSLKEINIYYLNE